MSWQLHWLEASGDSRPWHDTIAAEVEIARQAMADVLPVSPIDILVQRVAGDAIPEIGTAGRAYRSSLFALTLDPDNPNFERSVREGDLLGRWPTKRTIACVWPVPATAGRWARPWSAKGWRASS